MVPHEPQETVCIGGRRHGRDAWTVSEEPILEEVLNLLVEVVILQVVDNANVVDVTTASAQELVA